VRAGKPDPEGYRLAARELGVDPAACVVFEDAPAGIAAGLAAGAYVIAIATTHDRAELAAAGAIADSVAGALAMLGGLEAQL
jgi:sugar-phosphatase